VGVITNLLTGVITNLIWGFAGKTGLLLYLINAGDDEGLTTLLLIVTTFWKCLVLF
jgi:hypothetical protein